MSISPTSDLVFDVVQAADPVQYRASIEKLHNMRTKTSKSNLHKKQFASLVETKQSHSPISAIHNSYNVTVSQPSSFARRDLKEDKVNKQFEAVVLQSFIQDMFTIDTPSIFGDRQSGKFWKSLLIEIVATEIAQAGGIGIASILTDKQNDLSTNIPLI